MLLAAAALRRAHRGTSVARRAEKGPHGSVRSSMPLASSSARIQPKMERVCKTRSYSDYQPSRLSYTWSSSNPSAAAQNREPEDRQSDESPNSVGQEPLWLGPEGRVACRVIRSELRARSSVLQYSLEGFKFSGLQLVQSPSPGRHDGLNVRDSGGKRGQQVCSNSRHILPHVCLGLSGVHGLVFRSDIRPSL